jgi:response regulator RpfG family c-di-GMP phosphodiesterase
MSDKVLCLDDDPLTLAAYRAMHEHLCSKGQPFELSVADRPEQALQMIAAEGPYALVITDMQMPSMDGIEFLRWVKEVAPDTVRIMVTGVAVLEVAVQALHEGSIFRFFTKPCDVGTFAKAVAAGLAQYRLIRAEKELLDKTLTGCIEALTNVLAVVNPTAFGRAARIRHRVKQLARQLGAADSWQFEIAALLSQSGCIAVPEEIVNRVYRGAEVAPQEHKMFLEHPRVGRDLIAHIPRLEPVAQAIAYQEKRFDGIGTPADDIKGDAIPLAARVLKVALDFETLEAMGLSRTKALENMQQRPGWYDPSVINALQVVLFDDVELVRKEVSLAWLLAHLDAGNRRRALLERIVLAENVCTTGNLLVLSKGHEVTIPLLERLRNFSRHAGIRQPIHVWVPADAPTPSQPITGRHEPGGQRQGHRLLP